MKINKNVSRGQLDNVRQANFKLADLRLVLLGVFSFSAMSSVASLILVSDSAAPLTFLVPLFLAFYFLKHRKSTLALYAFFLVALFVSWIGFTVVFNFLTFGHQISPHGGDARLFYDLSTDSGFYTLPMETMLMGVVNAPLAVKAWATWYDLYSFFGVTSQPWLGLQLNVLCVLLTAWCLKYAIAVSKPRSERLHSLALVMYFSSGITLLYGTVFIRDAFVLLAVTALYLSFLNLKKGRMHILMLLICMVLFVIIMPFLRVKFMFIPLLFLLLYSFSHYQRLTLLNSLVLGAVLLPVLGIFFYVSGSLESILNILERNSDNYGELAGASGNGLGDKLILQQSRPIRTVLGFFYLHLQPIPFWIGWFADSSYGWFKSIYSLFNLLTFPYALMTLLLYVKSFFGKGVVEIPQPIRFSVLIYLFGFLGVAATSLETRHSGIFLPSYIVVVCFGICVYNKVGPWFRFLFKSYFAGVALIYILWAVLKYL